MGQENFGDDPVVNKESKEKKSFPEKIGRTAAAFLTAAAIGSVGEANPAYSQEQPQDASKVEKADMRKINEQRTLEFLEQLFNLPNNPGATNPVENKIQQRRAAEILIQAHVLRSKGMSSGNVLPEDMKNTRKELRAGLVAYGLQKFSDLNEMARALKDNPGYQALERELLKDQQL
jgi:hypothetical protein